MDAQMHELQVLIRDSGDVKRRSLRLPLDNSNSRVLRESVNNYMTQSTVIDIQDETMLLERQIELLQSQFLSALCSETIEKIERCLKEIEESRQKIHTMLKTFEPVTGKNDLTGATQNQISYQTLGYKLCTVLQNCIHIMEDYLRKQKLITDTLILTNTEMLEETGLSRESPVVVIKQCMSQLEKLVQQRGLQIKESHVQWLNSMAKIPYSDSSESVLTGDVVNDQINAESGLLRDNESADLPSKKPKNKCLQCLLAFIVTLSSVMVISAIVAMTVYFTIQSQHHSDQNDNTNIAVNNTGTRNVTYDNQLRETT